MNRLPEQLQLSVVGDCLLTQCPSPSCESPAWSHVVAYMSMTRATLTRAHQLAGVRSARVLRSFTDPLLMLWSKVLLTVLLRAPRYSLFSLNREVIDFTTITLHGILLYCMCEYLLVAFFKLSHQQCTMKRVTVKSPLASCVTANNPWTLWVRFFLRIIQNSECCHAD